jgi:Tol biopolymer transport system component
LVIPRILSLLTVCLTVLACGGSSGPITAGPRYILADDRGLRETGGSRSDDVLVEFDDGSFALDPAVSPDGDRLAFIRQSPARTAPSGTIDFGSDLYIADRDGDNAKETVRHSQTAEFIRTPAWLPTGQLLFSVRGRKPDGSADFRIEQLDLTSGRRTRVIENGVDPSVAPAGDRLVYLAVDPVTQAERLMRLNLPQATQQPLVGPDDHLALMSAFAWSPDSGRIAFAAIDLNAPPVIPGGGQAGPPVLQSGHPFAQDVWVVNADGSGLRRIAELAVNQPSIAWSKDGARLYVLGATGFWRVDAASGATEQIGPGVALGQIVLLSE